MFNIFSSAVLSRNTKSEMHTVKDDIENVPDEVDGDGTIVKTAVAQNLTENKVKNYIFQALETPEEESMQYIRLNNKFELNSDLNGKSDNNYCSDSSSNTSSNESISFRRIVLTPIDENEVKLSNGYDH